MTQATVEQWRLWYATARWKRRRAAQLQAEPWCTFHLRQGKHVRATVADHIQRHGGDVQRFWHGPLQSLCSNCHESAKKYLEARGYLPHVGVDGYPVDPKHPANRVR